MGGKFSIQAPTERGCAASTGKLPKCNCKVSCPSVRKERRGEMLRQKRQTTQAEDYTTAKDVVGVPAPFSSPPHPQEDRIRCTSPPG